MTYDRSKFEKMVAERNKTHIRERRGEIKAIALAGPAMEKLTGDPAWDFVLRALQAELVSTEAKIEVAKDQLADPALANIERMTQLKNQISYERGIAWGLKIAIDLPNNIKKQATDAREALKKIEGDKDT